MSVSVYVMDWEGDGGLVVGRCGGCGDGDAGLLTLKIYWHRHLPEFPHQRSPLLRSSLTMDARVSFQLHRRKSRLYRVEYISAENKPILINNSTKPKRRYEYTWQGRCTSQPT
jgi:hypothetical protein